MARKDRTSGPKQELRRAVHWVQDFRRCADPVIGTEGDMLKRVTRQEAEIYHLPGRDFFLCIGPANSDAKNVALGVAVFPGGSAPPGHVHPAEEEVIHILSGTGRLVTPEGTARLEPGVTVHIPPGLHHATAADGPEPLELVSVFSPPVIPGSYEVPRP